MSLIDSETLLTLFNKTFSVDQSQRKDAEQSLKSLEKPGFAISLLRLVSQTCDKNCRQAAGVYFKNFVADNWETQILEKEEKEKIRKLLIPVMLQCPEKIVPFLSAAVKEICKSDFPDEWPQLIPEIISHLQKENISNIKTVLSAINSVLEKFRYEKRTPKGDKELLYCAQVLVQPLGIFFQKLVKQFLILGKSEHNKLYCVLGLTFECFQSLITQELLENIEDASEMWLEGFKTILGLELPQDYCGPFKESGQEAKARIFRILTLFSFKYDDCEEYRLKEKSFVDSSFNIIQKASSMTINDTMVIEGMKYLETVMKKPTARELIGTQQTLNIFCSKIIFSNIYLRDSDIEEFEYNPMEFYRKHMENSQSFSRRRASFDLIQAISKNFEQPLAEIIVHHVEHLNLEYQQNPKTNWMKKDASLFLLLAIFVKGKTEKQGVVSVASSFNVNEFLSSNILPELTNKASNIILKADCIKILISFRSQIAKADFPKLIKLMSVLLEIPSLVLISYIANAIEKIFILKDNQGNYKLEDDEIKNTVYDILSKFFGVMDSDEFFGNEHIIRVIAVIINRAGQSLTSFSEPLLNKIYESLCKMLKNQSNGQFNHFMFETLAALISSVCKGNQIMLKNFENKLFPLFSQILSDDKFSDFCTYVFQLLALMLHLRTDIDQTYTEIYPKLLDPKQWIELSNAKPLTTLLVEFLRKSGDSLKSHLEPLLGVFQKLLSQRSNDYHSLTLLQAIFSCFDINEMQKYVPQIMKLLCIKLEKDRSIRFSNRFSVFFCSFVTLVDFEYAFKSFESVQKGLTSMFLEKLILPEIQKITSERDRMKCIFGFSTMLSSPTFVNAFGEQKVILLLEETLRMIEMPLEVTVDSIEELESLERAGYSVQYSSLAFARLNQQDAFSKLGTPKSYLAKRLGLLSQKFPLKIGPMIQSNLNQQQQNALAGFFKETCVSLA